MFRFLRTMRPSARFQITFGLNCLAAFIIFALKIIGGTGASALAWQLAIVLAVLAAMMQPWRYLKRLKTSHEASSMLERSGILAAVACLVPGQVWLLLPAAFFVFSGARSDRLVALGASASTMVLTLAVFRTASTIAQDGRNGITLLWLGLSIVLGTVFALVVEHGCTRSKEGSDPPARTNIVV